MRNTRWRLLLISPLFLLFLTVRCTWALELNLRLETDVQGSISEFVSVTCAEHETHRCRVLCGDSSHCLIPQPSCRNCYGTASPLLFELFNHASEIWTTSARVATSVELLSAISDGRHVLIGYQSLYNSYSSISSPDSFTEWRDYCPVGTNLPLWVVALDDSNQAQNVEWVICHQSKNADVLNFEATAYSVMLRTSLPLGQNTNPRFNKVLP